MLKDTIRELRKAAGYTQKDLAAKVNRTQQAVAKWECGIAEPDSSTLNALSSLFDVTIEYLLGISESKEYTKREKEYFSVTDFIKGLGYEELSVKYENEDGEFDEIGKELGTAEDGAAVFGSTDPQNEIENKNDGKKYLVPRLEWEELKRRIVRYSNFEISEYLSTKEPEKE